MKKEILETRQTVATVTAPEDLTVIEKSDVEFHFDILEFRFDNLYPHRDRAIQLARETDIPVLGTVRRAEEGGAHTLNISERAALYHEILPHIQFVDTEIATLAESDFSSFATDAKKAATLLIASYHDFNAFPGAHELVRQIDAAYELGAEIAKVAVHIDSMKDLFSLVELVEFHRENNRLISAMGMGPLGKVSRLLLAKAGSCLNYGYLQRENAPGQWSAAELSDLIAEL